MIKASSNKKNRKFLIKANDNELEYLKNLAAAYNISRAELIRRLFMNEPMPKPNEDIKILQEFRSAIVKTNADLARLGNLFKLAIETLDDHKKAEPLVQISREIAMQHALLKSQINQIPNFK